jgi:hypothetical protein
MNAVGATGTQDAHYCTKVPVRWVHPAQVGGQHDVAVAWVGQGSAGTWGLFPVPARDRFESGPRPFVISTGRARCGS